MVKKFSKYHGLGNSYIVIEPDNDFSVIQESEIIRICNPDYGIGSDGILFGPFREYNSISFKILNPDGSEAEKSGNGIRIFAKYLVDQGYIEGDVFQLFTKGGKVNIELVNPDATMIKVQMGKVSFKSKDIPVSGNEREVVNEVIDVNGTNYTITSLTIGNPHCVILVDKATEELARKIGSFIENHPLFPNRVNLQLLEVIDKSNINIQIWERGAGYTMASGSSSCAAASAAYKLGLVNPGMNVHMPGGEISINISENWEVEMTGPVEFICNGNIDIHF